jgi:hypothetical protein
MSVSNGQAADESVLNAAYISRTINSSTIGVLALNNSSSGGNISNAQQQINTNTSDIATNAADIATNAADIVTLNNSVTFNNLSATANPEVGDDSADGYEVGSIWVNTTDNKAFIAVDVSAGAAIWKRLDKIMFKTVSTAQLNFSSSPVGTSSYVELVADTGSDVIRKIEFFYPDGDAMILAVGAAASEVDTALVLAGGNELEVEIPANSRLSLKLATGGTTNDTGILSANLKAEA